MLGASLSDDTVEVIFETESSGFSSLDSNEESDIYRAIVSSGSNIRFELLTKSIDDSSATGISGSVSVFDNNILLVSTNGASYQVGYESGRQDLVALDLATGAAIIVTGKLSNLGSETEFFPGPISPSGGYLLTVTGSGNEMLDGQVIEILPDLSEYRMVSILGSVRGNDLSYNVIASDGERGGSVVAFQTSSSNLGVLPNEALVEAEFVDVAGAALFVWDGEGVFSERALQTSMDNISIATGDNSFVVIDQEQPADYLNLMEWVGDAPVMLRSKTSSADVTVTDIVSTIEAYLGVKQLSLTAFAAADIDGDGAIQVADIVSLIEIYLGISRLVDVVQFVDADTGSREIQPVIGETVNLVAVLIGDVDGSWSPEIM